MNLSPENSSDAKNIYPSQFIVAHVRIRARKSLVNQQIRKMKSEDEPKTNAGQLKRVMQLNLNFELWFKDGISDFIFNYKIHIDTWLNDRTIL